MKRLLAALVSLLAAGVCFGQKPGAPSEYAALVARVKKGEPGVNFQRLRFSYMESPERHAAKDTNEQVTEMVQALNRKDYKKVVENADVVLANEFVNMDAHFVEYLAYRELQNPVLSDFHHSVFSGLLKSITDSGDGKTKETAYVVITVHEEYVVLNVLGLRPGKQSVVHDGGHSYDLMETADPKTNQSVSVYFNVDIPFKHYLD